MFLVIVLALVAASGCLAPPVTPPVSVPATPVSTTFVPVPPIPADPLTLKVASLLPGAVLPNTYTCTGAQESPDVTWSNLAGSPESLVLVLDDPDAQGFTHWIVYNIPPEARR